MNLKINDNSTMTEAERKEWLEQRRKSIGSSDAAAIVGLDPYKSAMEVFLEKTGQYPEKEMNEAMRFGIDAEQYVADRFCNLTGKKLDFIGNSAYGNPAYPFATSSVDRWVSDEGVPVEIKTTSVWNLDKFKNGKFPDRYYVQCVHHMAVMQADYCYLVVYVPAVELMWFRIDRDMEEEKALMEAEKEFYEKYMLTGKMPQVNDAVNTYNALTKIRSANSEVLELKDSVNAYVEYIKLMEEQKRLDEKIRLCKSQIMAEMNDRTDAVCNFGKVSWKEQERTSIDKKVLYQKYPDLKEDEEILSRSVSRVLRITPNKI